MKMWSWNVDKFVEEFTVGDDYIVDKLFVKYDCKASIAHVEMLYKMNVLNKEEKEKIIAVLEEIIELSSKGKFEIKMEEEDCHTAIENYVIKKLGDLGKKMHMFRSRNEQIVTAIRLYCKEEIEGVINLLKELVSSLKHVKKKYGDVKIPGYTHTRKAMPSSIALWCESFIESMKDNIKLLKFIANLIDKSPAGSGAGYGLPASIDRKFLSSELGFKSVQNPLYVQNSRTKFEADVLHGLWHVMFDLNKIASDIILFSSDNFKYFSLPKNICTGSSIMPHKRNPDVLEIVRGNYHIIKSYEDCMKGISANLISGYHRDFQLTKKFLVKGFKIVKNCINAVSLVLRNIEVNSKLCKKDMSKELFSVEKSYKLAVRGIPFRDAHKIVSLEFS